jgi:tRNA pseudouridine38/39 synthase
MLASRLWRSWGSRQSPRICNRRSLATMEHTSPYASASREELLRRIEELEHKVASTSTATPSNGLSNGQKPSASRQSSRDKKKERNIDFSRYGRRKIALRFCYDGWDYCGLALQTGEITPLPTVEGVLLAALEKARLIPSVDNLEEIEFARSGRTDRGVSAAGQVISLWVRSQLSAEELEHEQVGKPLFATAEVEVNSRQPGPAPPLSPEAEEAELPYVTLLNRMLPPSIRILAWSPVSPSFDARFSCASRHYKYFFSTAPTGLDIELMRDAALRLVGEHDFRNLCKNDPSKQLVNFRRRILSATIDPVDGSDDADLYVLNLKGTAFLYHQVRHIMAVLFLVGARVEPPSVIDALFNVNESVVASSLPSLPIMRSKPAYEMADDLPLVLWDCLYPPDSVCWRISNGPKQLVAMHSHWTHHRIRSSVTRHFLDSLGVPAPTTIAQAQGLVLLQNGGGKVTGTGKYKPLAERPRGEECEVANLKWRLGRGARRAAAGKIGATPPPDAGDDE